MQGSRTAYLGLGSNLGDREGHLRHALARLGGLAGTRVVAVSAFVETEPVGPVVQGAFLNAAAAVETGMGARELLGHLHEIERERGRDRAGERRWGPRTLDIDVLLYDGVVMDEPGLTIPHPRLHERLFVLRPLAEIAPAVVVPGLGRTVGELLARLESAP